MRTKHRILITLAAAALLPACDNTSLFDTQPPFLTSGSGTGNVTGTSVSISASNNVVPATTPVSISVGVTQGNTPVPDNTSVSFTTNFGYFTDSSSPTTVARTSNGLAAASMTSLQAGIATVTVTVAGVSQTVTVTFTAPPGG